jgi:diguanylate cyclase (GGDEF)-like protein
MITSRAVSLSGEPADIQRLAQLGRFVRWLLPVTFLFTAIEALTFVVSPQPAIAVTASLTGGYGLWLLFAWRRARRTAIAAFAARMAMGMLIVIVFLAILQPDATPQLTVAALLPVILVLPYLDDHALRRFIGFAWVIAMFIAVMGELLPSSIVLPAAYTTPFRVAVLAAVFGLALFLLWQFSTRLKSSARELGSLVELSSDVVETMDPRQIGDLTAAHLARATGADECGICYWDRPGDRVLTYGYYPVDRRSAVDDVYDLAEYPATRRVLTDHVDMYVNVDQAGADPSEVEFLRSIGMQSMAMLPLVARGDAIGAVELYWRTGKSPEEARMGLGRSLAQAAAIALDNARLYEELRHQAFHDGLTGLANRALFSDRVEHALARSIRTGSIIGVLFVDLDDFKTVNDRFGHQAGDQLLRSIAERIVAILRPGDTAARLGGDEFAVLLEDLHGQDDARLVAERLIHAIRTPTRLGDVDALVGASIGIALSTAGGELAPDLLRNADFAMYRAKGAGKGRYEVFEASMRAGIAERAELEQIIHGAVDRGELRVAYQPIVELATGRAVGALDQDRELVAAQAGDRVRRARTRQEPLGRADQQPVTFGMAEGVVHGLEVVEVDEQHGDLVPAPAGDGERVAHPVPEQRAVGEPGERIVERLVGELLLQPLALAHVAGVEHDALDRAVVEQVGRQHLAVEPGAVRLAEPPLGRTGDAGRGGRVAEERRRPLAISMR